MTEQLSKEIINFIKTLYPKEGVISLHEPVFAGNEKKYLNDCIDSTYVSYVGRYVTEFEEKIKSYTGSKNAVAFVNGTSALHIALYISGVDETHEVLTQALTFIGTANAIKYCRAEPVFIDSEKDTMGMSPEKLEAFLVNNTRMADGVCVNKRTGKKIKTCIPVHIFGHPVKIQEIIAICGRFHISVVEDAAESLGSTYGGKHTGTFGKIGILSFNGNKVVTTGGGGMLITDDEELANTARHISTTAKRKHPWEFYHDQVGYNYRMTNLNAAIGCAQMEMINKFIESKREVARLYKDFFNSKGVPFFAEREGTVSNYWLNVIFAESLEARDAFLTLAHSNQVNARPVWQLMNRLSIFESCETTNLDNAIWLYERIINIPSSVRL